MKIDIKILNISNKIRFIILIYIYSINLMVFTEEVNNHPSHCGIAAVNDILNYISVYPDKVELVPDDYCSSSTELSLLDLKNILKQNGFDSYGFKLFISELDTKYLPAIAHLENHFVSILDCTDTHLLISDMNRTPVIITKRKFASSWTGNILSVKTNNNLFSGDMVEVRVNPEKNNPWSPMKINLGFIESRSPIKINWMIHNETNQYLTSYSIDSDV
jgi:ABC-type bacteriocin/lantibiotic exporter with double-glycine peptidase domain